MTDDRTDPSEGDRTDDEEPGYCRVCGDPVTGSDQFCAGCGASVAPGEEHEHEGGS